MKIYKYILLAVFCFIASSATLSAQQRISGQISDDMGPLMMVNVVEMDKDNRYVNHATTDFDGNFTMIVKNNKNKLKISYVGFKDEILEIGDRTVFNVVMKDENLIQEVVIQAKPRTNSGGLNILEREVSVAKQTRLVRLMKRCRDRLRVLTSCSIRVTLVQVLRCVCVVPLPSMVTRNR